MNINNQLIKFLSKFNKTIIPIDPSTIKRVNSLQKEMNLCMGFHETQEFINIVGASLKIEGDMAEVGAYKGGSAYLICEEEVRGEKTIHLFDTWEGHPEPELADDPKYYKGKCLSTLEEIKENLKEFKNILYYKGLFPSSARFISDIKFSFVHLDGDLYQQAKTGLEFFYPRMNKGGIIVVADYPRLSGVKKATEEFLKTIPEPIIEMTAGSAIIIKSG